LEGDPFAQAALDRMSAAELYAERGYDDWLVVDVSGARRNDVNRYLPGSVSLGRVTDGAAYVSTLKATVAERRRTAPNLKVAFVGASGDDADKIARVARRAGIVDAFVLDGGFKGYQDFHARQLAMWRQADRPARGPACNG
jgi:hypothetical protein